MAIFSDVKRSLYDYSLSDYPCDDIILDFTF